MRCGLLSIAAGQRARGRERAGERGEAGRHLARLAALIGRPRGVTRHGFTPPKGTGGGEGGTRRRRGPSCLRAHEMDVSAASRGSHLTEDDGAARPPQFCHGCHTVRYDELLPCELCSKTACGECLFSCDNCYTVHCGDCVSFCDVCDCVSCPPGGNDECSRRCDDCGRDLCVNCFYDEDGFECDACDKTLCGDCAVHHNKRGCSNCENMVCDACCGRWVDLSTLDRPYRELPHLTPFVALEKEAIRVQIQTADASGLPKSQRNARLDGVRKIARWAMAVDDEGLTPIIYMPTAAAHLACAHCGDDDDGFPWCHSPPAAWLRPVNSEDESLLLPSVCTSAVRHARPSQLHAPRCLGTAPRARSYTHAASRCSARARRSRGTPMISSKCVALT